MATLNLTLEIGSNLADTIRSVFTPDKDQIMATLAEFLDKLDAASIKITNIATELAALKEQIANGGMTADEEAQVLAKVDALNAALDAASPGTQV